MKKTVYALLLLLAFASTLHADKTAVDLSFAEGNSNIFGGTKVQFHISLASQNALQGQLAWRFSAAGRTIARGESAVSLNAGVPETVSLDLQVPPVKKGV